jgi:CheY-like chemotaxis protein
MGGMECSSAIAEEWPMHGTPIIAVTADAFEESRQRCLDAGFTGWLSKPFRIDGMLNILSSILQQVELRRNGQAAAATS